ncbi:hypothetical protein LEP3755_32540 [Leptolyngbya sp. NIES-3755]|nr:hypothetical protein LEP3755_32540 [Leptolyngbya sp. NIES-3755]
MLNTTFALLILIPFILGFITYGIRKLIQPSVATVDPVTVKLSPEAMQQLREKGYLDPNTGKLKDSVVGLLNLEEATS